MTMEFSMVCFLQAPTLELFSATSQTTLQFRTVCLKVHSVPISPLLSFLSTQTTLSCTLLRPYQGLIENVLTHFRSRCVIRDTISNREAVGFAPSICQGGVYEDITVRNLRFKRLIP